MRTFADAICSSLDVHSRQYVPEKNARPIILNGNGPSWDRERVLSIIQGEKINELDLSFRFRTINHDSPYHQFGEVKEVMDAIWKWAEEHKIPEYRLYFYNQVNHRYTGGEHSLLDQLDAQIIEDITEPGPHYSPLLNKLFLLTETVTHNPSPDCFDLINEWYCLRTGISFDEDKLIKSIILDLDGEELEYIPEEISYLPIKFLNLSGVKCANPIPPVFFQLENLTHLWLCNCGLESLPSDLIKTQNLLFLDLRGNENLRLTDDEKNWVSKMGLQEVVWVN